MHNVPNHTKAALKNRWLIFLAFLIISLASGAQEQDTTVSVDTSDTAVEIQRSKFDSLNSGGLSAYQPHFLPDSIIENLKKQEDFWYADLAPGHKKTKEPASIKYSEPFYLKQWFRTAIWALIIIGFLGVLVWFLIASDVRLFRTKARRVASVSDDVLPDDIFSINYDQELQKAMSANNYRLAVRVMYLHILKLLADGEVIQYKMERTNSDYLLQLYRTGYYKDFFRLTRNFEYVWYGKFELSESAFQMVKQDYQNFKSRLPA